MLIYLYLRETARTMEFATKTVRQHNVSVKPTTRALRATSISIRAVLGHVLTMVHVRQI